MERKKIGARIPPKRGTVKLSTIGTKAKLWTTQAGIAAAKIGKGLSKDSEAELLLVSGERPGDEKSENAQSRWARAPTAAAKIGKGLSKDSKAEILPLKYWIEVVDPQHRYGRNLSLYFENWLESNSSQSFLYWLDDGDGKQLNLAECPREVLRRQCIKYLGPIEREAYEVIIKNGKLVYKKNGMFVNTDENTKWIFLFSPTRKLYVGKKKKGSFGHTSFLAGGAVIAAGRFVARDGVLLSLSNFSVYKTSEENFSELLRFLEKHKVNLHEVQVQYTGDFQLPPVGSPSASLIQKTEHSIDIERNDHGKGNSERCSKATIARIFVITNFMLEVISAALDQLSSPRKTYFALLAMLTSFVGTFICISQLIYQGREEKVTWRRKNNIFWFYSPSPSNKRLGTFVDIIGLVCGIFQSIFSTIGYSYLCRHADNPIKISIWPIIFAFGLLCSTVFKNPESSTLQGRQD